MNSDEAPYGLEDEAGRMIPPPLQAPRYLLALVLFGVTLLTTATLGPIWWVSGRTDMTTALPLFLLRSTIESVWGNRELLAAGFAFAIPLLTILLAHELGHYLWCRYYRLPATAPLFLPAPFGFGTLGAFIRIRAPLRDKRQLLDVGAGGPIAGFVALLPFLFLGIARSQPAAIQPVDALTELRLIRPGSSLLMELVVRLFHGDLPPDTVLDLHPFALAAWAGLLATSINLLPVGQLDGGHILYAAAGKRQRPVARVLWILMGAAGFLWPGWWLLALLVLIFGGLRHPPVLNESVRLDGRRQLVAWASLAILVLSFMPAPIEVFFLEP